MTDWPLLNYDAVEGIRRGLNGLAEGRVEPVSEAFAKIRNRRNIPHPEARGKREDASDSKSDPQSG
jgi:hypothetical protein